MVARACTLIACLALVLAPSAIADQAPTLAELLLTKETNPRTVLEARQAARRMGLPISLYFSQGVIVEVLATENGTPVYGVMTNMAHPLDGGFTATYEEVVRLYDLSQAIDLSRGPYLVEGTIASSRAAGSAGLLLVPDWTADKVLAFDPASGNLVDTAFIPSTPGPLASPKEALGSPRGTITVSDQISDGVQDFDTSGAYLGIFAPAGGVNTAILDNIRGHAYRPNGNLVVTVASSANAHALAEFDATGTYIGNFVANGAGGLNSPFGILFRENDLLVTQSSTPTGVQRYDLNGNHIAQWTAISSFPQQIIRLSSGIHAVANFSGTGNSGIRLYQPDGTFIRLLSGVTGNRGVAQIANGNFLTTNGTGIHEIDSTTGSLVRTILAGANLQYITFYDPNPNSISVTAPNGGEIWIVGNSEEIRWNSSGAVDSVRIDYSTNNGGSWNSIAASVPAATGSFTWMVPPTATNEGRVRITWVADTTVSDVSDGTFIISTTNLHDLGVVNLSIVSGARPVGLASQHAHGDVVADAAEAPYHHESNGVYPVVPTGISDTVHLQVIVQNFGSIAESTYQVQWTVDGIPQGPKSNTAVLAPGARDTLRLKWPTGPWGVYSARAWSVIQDDFRPANDTSSTLLFRVGRAPGDTLYTFIIPGQIILGVAKMGPSQKLAFTSGGQVAGTTTTDNKWIITDLYGSIIDTTFMQVNPTTGQGFGFRDLAWDGRWLLTSDDARMRRIDTTTFTEVLPPFTTQTNPNRGIGVQSPNRIWVSNFTTNPVRLYDTTGTIVRVLGTPTVAPYGIATDPWTTPGKMYLWYSEPSSTTGPRRLSKADTTTGAILATYDYSPITVLGATSGGLDIVNDHPGFPGRIVAFLVIQNFPNSKVIVVDLGMDSTIVSVSQDSPVVPDAFRLGQNFPNPFNPSTRIEFSLPRESYVSLEIFDVLGRKVASLVNEVLPAGIRSVEWDGKESSSGVYFYRLAAASTDGKASIFETRKMILQK